ncbi:hypothetical protein SELMODRAFT_271951 [Selaginella moellendorffii]|uniref:Deubiquitinating enzyme MINDY-3/4 conserved domain-containing protein n=1 Tax=Selaginella moellendorffii TaxID=88036 RepID=D8SX15_SELML|nr:ubiquitin carboxyl-terminal hydrolase MINDY-3 [Selaginella moellendorffii]EFJ11004.1 hypothetical protein SELMODRAFT_271951 [Selaginella moellendorffii]|eukprot:XP_002987930.1 ubiquitin carboxyl-terminal hydrolase MINDY-3 [Selaginella moellendorffii]
MEALDDEELQRAFRMSLQPGPEAKRTKSRDTTAEAPDEASQRRLQREIRAAAAEKRRLSAAGNPTPSITRELEGSGNAAATPPSSSSCSSSNTKAGEELPLPVAEQLHQMVFGPQVTREVLAQWCNQGFRFSSDLETSLGLVQHEGGPCGVLATIQATLLKYLLFVPNKRDASQLEFQDSERTSALIQAMAETLWRAGGNQRAVLAVMDIPDASEEEQDRVLESVALDSATGLREAVRICTVLSLSTLYQQIQERIAGFRSRMGALLFLFSALLSRGLDAVQSDRDDPVQPLVTPPFGHASQEIVNLLLCGQAVANVFDGNYDLGGGMSLKGIPSNVEVGFLTLLESLNFCKVGQYLKRPKWPIWVVGSESHYTVLFALDTGVQDENEVEAREFTIRRAFDAQDQSGGGGFISLEALQQVLIDTNVDMPQQVLDNLCSSDIVIWNDLWQSLMHLEKSRGGLKDEEGSMGKKYFELYHFNGIAKTVAGSSGSSSAGAADVMQQRPRLTKLKVAVPPRWTPESMMTVEGPAVEENTQSDDKREEPAQHAPLTDCIRTRWQRATSNWTGDPPSIV